MVVSLWDIANALIGTAVLAAQSVVMPIPQTFDYGAMASYQINSGHFSTDPTSAGRVAAIETEFTASGGVIPRQGNPVAGVAGVPQLEAFIITNSTCNTAGTPITYRLFIRNSGRAAATEITVQNQYPDKTSVISATRTPDDTNQGQRLLTWREGGLTVGNFLQYTLTISGAGGTLTDLLTVDYFDDNPVVAQRRHFRTQTSHTLDDKNCGNNLSPTSPLPKNKFAAIICDPAETSCQSFMPKLGIKFQNAKGAIQNPVLGKRFEEAIADIVPGECSVVADDIISTPDYQDALNRRGKPADAYIEPLYQSGQDFKQLVHEDMLLGWDHVTQTRQQLQKLHLNYWQQHSDIIDKVISGKLSGSSARDQIQKLLDPWQQQLIPLQQDASRQYVQLQDKRAQKFDAVAQKAIQNAQSSIQRACGSGGDGGLSQSLPAVKKAYELVINGRTTEFATTQQRFSTLRAVQLLWQEKLYSALSQFDSGNKELLRQYRNSVEGPGRDQTFDQLFELYYQHVRDDETAFNRVRLDHFEKALDAPKTEATICEKKKVFGPPVETSWCESGRYPESIIRGAPRPVKTVLPPDTASLNTATSIDVNQVRGQVCGGKPGDPWWAKGCICQCNEAMPTGALDANGNPILVACQGLYPIVLHDIYATTKAECLAQAGHHDHGSDLAPF